MWTVIVATVLGWFSAVQAQLVVSKEYSDPHLVAGMSRTITYHLFNLGKDSVTNINLEDATFKRNFTIDQGTLPLQLAELKPYPLLQTIASCRNERYAHQVMVTPTTIGRHPDLPAFIKYQRPKVATTSEGVGSTEELEWASVMSTARGLLQVMSEEDYNVHVKPHRQEWLLFTGLAILIVGLPYRRYQSSIGKLHSLTAKSK